jgi:hypothetical protein
MSGLYELEKIDLGITAIGNDCYLPEHEPPCEPVVNPNPNEMAKPPDVRQIDVRSCFNPETPNVFWQSLSYKPFGMIIGSPVKFIPPESTDFIYNACYQVHLPTLRIKREYRDTHRIRWQKYVCFSIIEKADIRPTNGVPICSLDQYGQEFCHAYMRDSSHSEGLERDAGNSPSLNTWTTHLREEKCCCPLYWFYSILSVNGFPLYKLGEKSLEHCFNFDKDISRHLCMQRFVDGRWQWMKPDLEILERLPSSSIPDPILFGEFTANTPCEKALVFDNHNSYYIDDIVATGADNSISFGETFVVNLKTGNKLCRAIFGAVENMTAREYNDRFNYTDNAEDSDLGESPIEYVHLYYSDTSNTKLGPCDISHFRSTLISKHFKSAETNKGHFAIALDHDAWKIGSGSGIVPEKLGAKFVCKLRDKRPEDKDCRFSLILRMRVSKKLVIDEKQGLICL